MISEDETELINQRIHVSASPGFTVSGSELQKAVREISLDDREGFQSETNLPSMETVRKRRSNNRNITFRKAESMEVSKLRAEGHTHV